MNKRAKRILIAIPVTLVTAFVLYVIVGLATYWYLCISYNSLKPGMSRFQVRSRLRGFTESVAGPELYKTYNLKSVKYATVKRYDLLGLRSMEMTIAVAYDKDNRVTCAIDIYE